MINTIFFDLDNTLLDFDKAERNAVSKTLLHLGITPDETVLQRYSELNLAQWKLLEQGKLTRSEVKVRRFRLLFEEIGVSCSAEKAAAIYEPLLGQGHYFVTGAPELLKKLYGQYRMYLVTNGTKKVQIGRLESAHIGQYFDGVFISEDIGYHKPDKAFFDSCFAQIADFSEASAVIVGDSLTSDIRGGINAGIQTVWFNPRHMPVASDIRPDYEINALAQLPLLLQALS